MTTIESEINREWGWPKGTKQQQEAREKEGTSWREKGKKGRKGKDEARERERDGPLQKAVAMTTRSAHNSGFERLEREREREKGLIHIGLNFDQPKTACWNQKTKMLYFTTTTNNNNIIIIKGWITLAWILVSQKWLAQIRKRKHLYFWLYFILRWRSYIVLQNWVINYM